MDSLAKCPFCGGEARMSGERFENTILSWVYCVVCGAAGGYRHTEAEAIAAWNTRAERTCKLEPLKAFYVTANMLDQTEWGVCSSCGTASPIDATYCCECGRKVER